MELFYNSYVIRLEYNVVETLICEALFLAGHSTRPYFYLRIIAIAFVCIGICFPLGALYAMSVDTKWFLTCKLFVYFFSYGLSVAAFFFCYRDCFSEIFLCGISGIAGQSLLSNVAGLIYGDIITIAPSPYAYQLLDLLRQLPIFVAIYFIFAFRCPKLKANGQYGFMIGLATVTLIVTIGLGGTFPIYKEESQPLNLICTMFAIMCALFVLIMRRGLIVQIYLRQDLAVEETLRAQEKKQYDILKNSTEQINIKCHDLKHQLARLHGRLDEDTLAGLSSAVSAFDSVFHTNNQTLDIILNDKNGECMRRGIRFTCMGDASAFNIMKPADLYSLFGNAIDNAIEAAGSLEPEKRAINLVVSSKNGAEFDLMNYFKGKLTLKDGLPETTKDDKLYHGYGVRSMQLTVREYGGNMYFSADEDVFTLHISIPQP